MPTAVQRADSNRRYASCFKRRRRAATGRLSCACSCCHPGRLVDASRALGHRPGAQSRLFVACVCSYCAVRACDGQYCLGVWLLTLQRCLSPPRLVLQIMLLTLFSFIENRLDMPGHSEFFMYSTICTTSIMVVAGIVGAFPTSMRFTYGVLRTFVPLSLSGSTRGSRSPVCRLSFRPLLNHPTWSYRRPDDLEEGYFAAGWP